MPSGLLHSRPGWERRKMSEQRIRLNLWFHRDNEKQSMAHEYITAAKKAGKSCTEYITDCVLEHEEGERICFRARSLDTLADMVAQKIREKPGKGMGL
jgi:hypothetical protein